MKIFNIKFTNSILLIDFINKNNINSFDNILVQVFSSIIDEQALLDITLAIKNNLPQSNIIGTTTAGEILDGKMYDEAIVISFSCFEHTKIKTKLFNLDKQFHIDDVTNNVIDDDTKALIIFSDGLKSNAEELLKKLTLSNPHILIAGGRAADYMQFQKTFVFDEDTTTQNGFVVASLSGDNLIVNSDYILNWNQIGKEMTVTKANGNIVYEVDGIENYIENI